MGTNYYAETKKCSLCGRSEKIHIGKSSAGWRFLFRGYGSPHDDGSDGLPKDVTGWHVFLGRSDVRIVDEYEHEVTLEEFWWRVGSKSDHKRHSSEHDRTIHEDEADITFGEFS